MVTEPQLVLGISSTSTNPGNPSDFKGERVYKEALVRCSSHYPAQDVGEELFCNETIFERVLQTSATSQLHTSLANYTVLIPLRDSVGDIVLSLSLLLFLFPFVTKLEWN